MPSSTPYLAVVDEPRRMAGKGAPRQTTFGVLGRTIESPYNKSLGGLVVDSKSAPIQKGTVDKHPAKDHTEHDITSRKGKTHIDGSHYGQVPYPGRYMAPAGKRM
jgi:hypothetical protein